MRNYVLHQDQSAPPRTPPSVRQGRAPRSELPIRAAVERLIEEFKDVKASDGERLVFEVQSRTNMNQKHRVDMEAYNGNGQCSCGDFSYHHNKLLKHGAYPARNLRCWHLARVREFLGARVIYRALMNQIEAANNFPPGQ